MFNIINPTLTRVCNNSGNGALFLIGECASSLKCVQTATNALADKCLTYVRSRVTIPFNITNQDIKVTLGGHIAKIYSSFKAYAFFRPVEMILSHASGCHKMTGFAFMLLSAQDFNDPKLKPIKTAALVTNIAMGVFCLSTGGLGLIGALNLASNIIELEQSYHNTRFCRNIRRLQYHPSVNNVLQFLYRSRVDFLNQLRLRF